MLWLQLVHLAVFTKAFQRERNRARARGGRGHGGGRAMTEPSRNMISGIWHLTTPETAHLYGGGQSANYGVGFVKCPAW
jgi:hypothetical protein